MGGAPCQTVFWLFGSLQRFDRLAVVLAMLPDTHEKYRQLGIEDTVFADTMS